MPIAPERLYGLKQQRAFVQRKNVDKLYLKINFSRIAAGEKTLSKKQILKLIKSKTLALKHNLTDSLNKQDKKDFLKKANAERRASGSQYYLKKGYWKQESVVSKKLKYMAEYLQRPEIRKRKKEYFAKLCKTPEYISRRKKYLAEYYARPEVKGRLKKYYSNPEVQLKIQKYQLRYRAKFFATLKNLEYERAHNKSPESLTILNETQQAVNYEISKLNAVEQYAIKKAFFNEEKLTASEEEFLKNALNKLKSSKVLRGLL